MRSVRPGTAPGLKWRKQKSGRRIGYWLGFVNGRWMSRRLWAGDEIPTDQEREKIAGECRRLQMQMLGIVTDEEKSKGAGVIYFIEAGGLVKIGYTINLKQRMTILQTGSQSDLNLIGTIGGDRVLEKSLHRRFAHLHAKGEWFMFSEEIKHFLKINRVVAKEHDFQTI